MAQEIRCYYEPKESHRAGLLLFRVWSDFCLLHCSETHFTNANFRISVIRSSLVAETPQQALLSRQLAKLGTVPDTGKTIMMCSPASEEIYRTQLVTTALSQNVQWPGHEPDFSRY
jgi:hypothetical protein